MFTGGKYTPPGTYDLASFLGTISADQSDYYLLGFTPSGDSAGKPCHKLKVKVDRNGLEIDARDTYCTTGQPLRALSSAQKALDARAVGGAGTLTAGLQVAWYHSRRNDTIVEFPLLVSDKIYHTRRAMASNTVKADCSDWARFAAF